MEQPAAVVFSGPSLAACDHSVDRNMILLGPAKCGDIFNAAERHPRAICLIDGTFESHPAVWHKEILYALHRGIPVVGAASMGALRAAECAAFGMIGIGYVFQCYAAGHLTCDSDVAVVHAPAELGYQPLSVSLVDVQYSAARAVREGRLDQSEQKRLVSAARSLGFRERTWKQVIVNSAISQTTENALHEGGDLDFSIKTADAVAALDYVARMAVSPLDTPGWELQDSQFFAALRARLGHGRQSGH
ncbi:MAG: TfuA-like protein [Alphaproteobacteria bacterium]|nr:TfuA-like protein [Alphaproteobacteria bacterium]